MLSVPQNQVRGWGQRGGGFQEPLIKVEDAYKKGSLASAP